jgi:alpha-beta hydrolase superfamily lysophospholipase
MGLVAGQDDAIDGYEPVQLRRDRAIASRSAAAMFRRRSAQPSRRAVMYLQTSRDGAVPADLASWYTERGFHFYVAGLRWPGRPHRPRQRGGKALAAAFAELDDTCAHLRGTDGIDNVIVTAHGEGASAAALWCAAESPAARADALILYAPSFGKQARRGLEIPCPVLVIGGGAAPAETVHLGGHVTWLRPADGEARPDASDAQDRNRFFDEMGRWLGAYMYGPVRDQLL